MCPATVVVLLLQAPRHETLPTIYMGPSWATNQRTAGS